MLYYSGFVLYDEDILRRKQRSKRKAREKQERSKKRGIYAYTEDAFRGRC
jgi:hypothetical protein